MCSTKSTRRYNTQDRQRHLHHHDNLKSRTFMPLHTPCDIHSAETTARTDIPTYGISCKKAILHAIAY
jgi:uncharacterized lipoprotein